MATYLDRLAIASNKTFGDRVRFAFILAAQRLLKEHGTQPEDVAWATLVLSGQAPSLQLSVAATLCAADEGIGEAGPTKATDEAIQAVIDKNLDYLRTLVKG